MSTNIMDIVRWDMHATNSFWDQRLKIDHQEIFELDNSQQKSTEMPTL